mmetsp:Transcript_7633/g.9989  ORF Transcript_7633/g.9989 Transcript_7633/m.9989 type:complete len:263 (+) Transcript_7633:116-904(+)|eukprot:CAMPEP_0198146832 /NCGR_PEP_ID=MMETSP1443-20131203/31699_1 /TAXON_ID=186043 /ORGANISM="Entomoneis sp., Strain CCMP2396" /LENGTH=262 /DNA_ID=CAMNT_0043810919 /DNA_START=65 /DNA_END=853 /DNA_ORIENTATION=+
MPSASSPIASGGGGSAPLNPNEESIPMLVHVTAPASLPAGYTFEAEINGNPEQIITCEVPEGGVTEGQLFMAPLPVTFEGARLRAPVGKWKDNLFGFFNEGVCHASLCCALWCTPLAMAQSITRMTLSWLGEPGTWTQAQRAFKVICVLVGCYLIYSTSLNVAALAFDEDSETPLWIVWGKFLGTFVFTVYNIYSLCRARETLRARYQIPEEHCTGCEDLCCAVWCSCCVSAQMLRHTGEYEVYPGVCCSASGHPDGTPKCV